MEDKTKIIQNPNTPKYDTTSGLLTDYGKSLGLKEVNMPTTINSSNLASVTGTKLPPPTPPTDTSAIKTAVNETLSQADSEKKAFLEKQKTETSGMGKLYEFLGQEGAMIKTAAEDLGAYERLKEYDQYTGQIEREQKAVRDRVKRISETFGGTTRGAQDEINKAERESASYQADLAINQNIAGRNYDRAMAIAKDKVEIELAPKKAELAKLQYIYDNNKPFQTAEFSSILNRKQKEIDREEERQTKGNEMIITAIQGKAPSTLVTKAKDILNKGGSLADVTSILGNYSVSLNDRLDTQYKQAQINKINREISLIGEPTPAEKKATETAIKNAQQSIPVMNDKIEAVDLLLDHPGLNSRVGTTAATRTPTTFGGVLTRAGTVVGIPALIGGAWDKVTGSGQSFAGGIHKLTSGLSLDSLIEAKARGATFGALSDQEMRILSSAATKLADWELKDKNGFGKGVWNIDEKSFKEELRTIQNLTREALLRSQGTLMTEDEESMLNDVFSDNNQVDPSNYYN